jgi:hypothetical protein
MGNQFANGIGGALSLALIAFSTVFLVLGGLTLIIFCVQYLAAIGEGGKKKKTPPSGGAPARPAPAAVPAPASPEQAKGSNAEGSRLAAVISAAILASTGRAVRIKSITPAGRHKGTIGGGWRASALLENSQGMVRDPWSRR